MTNSRRNLHTTAQCGWTRAIVMIALLSLLIPGVLAEERGKPVARSASEDAGQSEQATPQAQELEQTVVIRGAEHSAPVTPYVFDGDVRDLPRPIEWKPGDPIKEIPRRFFPSPGTEGQYTSAPPQGPDPLLLQQSQAPNNTSNAFTTPSRNFPGQGFSGVNPPDTVGDVGPNHYIQSINGGGGALVRIWDKAEPTPNVLSTFSMDSLGTGSCANGLGDPVILWDRAAERWFMLEFSSGGNRLCTYISQTSDPVTGGWYNYDFQAPSFPDYPKFGVWPTDANGGAGSYVGTANDGGPGIYALDRGKMLVGDPATFQRLTIPGLPGFGFEAPTPADVDGEDPPPVGAEAIIMRHRDTENHSGPAAPGDLLEMWLFDVDWVDTGNTTLTQQTSIDVSEFDSDLCGLTSFFCFPQPSGPTLDPLREVIMFRLQYRNSSTLGQVITGNLVTDVNGANLGGLRWFELRGGNGNWSLHQEGTYSPDSDNRWMASSAMDQSGNFAIAYNVSSTSTFPSLRYSGRLVDDPPGTLTQTETSILAGTAANSSNRYGDYASMNVDPEDDCTFWFTGEGNLASSWTTQVASFAFDACGCETPISPLTAGASVPGDNEIEISWNDADLLTVVEYTIQRSRTPGGPYSVVGTVADTSPGVAGGSGYVWSDTTVSGGVDYYYIVRASDGISCKSPASNEVSATATGICLLPPLFAGLQSVTSPSLNNCTLDLAWAPGTDECGGPLTYNVYRSTTAGFTPGAANLIAEGVSTTVFSDFDQLVDAETYHYVVRAVDSFNDVEESNSVSRSGSPQGAGGTCTTVSSCADNPFVDVLPNGLTTECSTSGFYLEAVPTGGVGALSYQWTRDGVDIPGANSAIYAPTDLGTHSYNVKVQAPTCPGFVFDGLDSDVLLVDAPFFNGVTSVTNPQDPSCGLDVNWDAGSTVCPGPVRYFVYRDTASPVAATEDNLVAAGVLGTTFRDSADLANRTTYNYLVRAQESTTGQTDTNIVQASAFPDGPGSGPQAVLNEDFEDEGRFLSDWTVTTGPGVHTCGEWDRSTSGSQRPSGSSGAYAVANNECNPLLGRTSTTMTSPAVNADLANMIGITLEYDIWYNHDGNETAKIEVFDGNGWVQVWQDANSDLNGHQSIDVTAYAAGNTAFQVRFDYQDATQDKWFSVDNVQVIVLVDVECSTPAAGPAAVPNGSAGSTPLLGSRGSLNGDAIDVDWDASTCGASSFNLIYGDLANVASYGISGSECSLGGSGSYNWSGVPAGNLFFLVVATDGGGVEGSWGRDGYGAERDGLNDSGQCAVSLKDPAATCP